MDQRALDRAIDRAAGELMAREPGGALRYNVMAGIREDEPPTQRWILWAATASLFLCAAVATIWMSRVPAAVVSPPPVLQLRVARGAVVPIVPVELLRDTPRARFVALATVKTGVAPSVLPSADAFPIAVIEMTPIAMTEIDMPQLEREATAIEIIDIEPLTIEPLAASND